MAVLSSRRRGRRGAVVTAVLVLPLLLAGLVAPAAAQTSPATPAAGGKPNIVFVLTDDLDAQSYQLFPHIKQLLTDQGVTFDRYFVDDSLCCPSRSSIFRGQLIHNTQVYGNRPPDGGYEKFLGLGHEDSTVATWLEAAGYRTAMMGKYLNGYPNGTDPTHVPPGWTQWDVPTTNSAYGEFDYTLNEDGKLVTYGHDPRDYLVDVMAAKGTDFVKRSAAAGQPFFLELATYAPHSPATAAPRYADAFPGVKAPRDPAFDEPDVSDKPAWLQAKPRLDDQAIARIDALYRKRLQSMLAVDDLVANLVQTLQDTGQLANTYIVFSSDNGFHLGQHRLPQGKQTAFETDIRVPLVVRGPGIPAGQVRDGLAMNSDLAPTFAEWAGVTPPDFVDGRSLAPLLGAQPPATWRRAVVVEHLANATNPQDPDSENAAINTPGNPSASPVATNPSPAAMAASPTASITTAPAATPAAQGAKQRRADRAQARAARGKKANRANGPKKAKKAKKQRAGATTKGIPLYRAMRTDRYVYVEYQDGARELYDLTTDPYELQNLAATADQALLQSLSTHLAQLAACAGPTCRTDEDAPVPDIAGASATAATPAATPADRAA